MIVFDTDVISFVLRPSPASGLIRRLAAIDADDQATTSITIGELVYGAVRSPKRDYYLSKLKDPLLKNLKVLPCDRESAWMFGELKAETEHRGIHVTEPDLRIAAICIRFGAVLATGNLRHFEKIPGLSAEDWLAPHR